MDEVPSRRNDSSAATDDALLPGAAPLWFQLHPRVVDLLLVLAIFVYNLPIQFGAMPSGLWWVIGWQGS